MAKLVPAILSEKIEDYKKFAKIYSEITDTVHIDVMDGIYVESKSPDLIEILESIKDLEIKKTIHVMSSDPVSVLDKIVDYQGIEYVYIHADVFELSFLDRKYPFKLALALNPAHVVDEFLNLILAVDAIMILTVKPGEQGAEFLPQNLMKISEARDKGFVGEVHIDGHVNKDTIEQILDYKPDLLNVGSAVQHAWNPKHAYEELNKSINR